MTLAPEGRKLLRVEQRNSAVPVERKPEWIKAKVQMGPESVQLKNLVKKEGLHTVCEEAGCPNIFECWEDKEATFLIDGSECTCRCDFCQIDTGKPSPVDVFEPTKVARLGPGHAAGYATVTDGAFEGEPVHDCCEEARVSPVPASASIVSFAALRTALPRRSARTRVYAIHRGVGDPQKRHGQCGEAVTGDTRAQRSLIGRPGVRRSDAKRGRRLRPRP
jgi:hypothetical protein